MKQEQPLTSARVMAYLVTLDIPNSPEGRLHDLRIARNLIDGEISRIVSGQQPQVVE